MATRFEVLTMSNAKQENVRRAEGFLPRFTEGVVLLDRNQRVMAFDAGAAGILKHQGSDAESPLRVPQKVLDILRDPESVDMLYQKLRLQVADQIYCCRIHVARRFDELNGPVTVIHLTREVSMNDAVTMISEEYRLTVREQQALRGVLRGLTSKQVAEQMSISPNTVKAFLRLVMGKMGVSSRTGIVAKLFDSKAHD